MNPETEPIPQRKWIAALCGAFATGALVASVGVWTFVSPGHVTKVRPIEPQLVIEPLPVRVAADTSDDVPESDDWHREVEASDAALPRDFPAGIEVSVFPDLSAERATAEGETALDGNKKPGMKNGPKKTVSATRNSDGSMYVAVTTGDWYSYSVVVLTLSSVGPNADAPHIDAAWRKWADVTPPGARRARAVTGNVSVNTKNWQTDRPLILEWDLYGLYGGRDAYLRCDHDKVIIQ